MNIFVLLQFWYSTALHNIDSLHTLSCVMFSCKYVCMEYANHAGTIFSGSYLSCLMYYQVPYIK